MGSKMQIFGEFFSFRLKIFRTNSLVTDEMRHFNGSCTVTLMLPKLQDIISLEWLCLLQNSFNGLLYHLWIIIWTTADICFKYINVNDRHPSFNIETKPRHKQNQQAINNKQKGKENQITNKKPKPSQKMKSTCYIEKASINGMSSASKRPHPNVWNSPLIQIPHEIRVKTFSHGNNIFFTSINK